MVEADTALFRPAIDDCIDADRCMAIPGFSRWTLSNPGDVITEYRQGCRGNSDDSQSWSGGSMGYTR